MFTKGNKYGKGRPKGTGKRQNVAEAFQAYLAGNQRGKERFTLAMERLFKDDLKTFLAYAYGRPTEFQVIQNPASSTAPPISICITGGILPRPKQIEAQTEEKKQP